MFVLTVLCDKLFSPECTCVKSNKINFGYVLILNIFKEIKSFNNTILVRLENFEFSCFNEISLHLQFV
jgi:hypothetical protein